MFVYDIKVKLSTKSSLISNLSYGINDFCNSCSATSQQRLPIPFPFFVLFFNLNLQHVYYEYAVLVSKYLEYMKKKLKHQNSINMCVHQYQFRPLITTLAALLHPLH